MNTQQFESLTTKGFFHDLSNIVTEIILLSKYKNLPEYAWRKNSTLQKEWGKTLMAVKFSLKRLNITPEQILLYWKISKKTSFSCGDFGLVHWYFTNNKLNNTIPLPTLMEHYRNLYKQVDPSPQHGIIDTIQQASKKEKDFLFKIKRK